MCSSNWTTAGAASALVMAVWMAACSDPVRAPLRNAPDDGVLSAVDLAARDTGDASVEAAAGLQVRELVLGTDAPLEIGGAPAALTIFVSNSAGRPRAGYQWRLDITQGAAWREQSTGPLDCGAGPGVLPPGRCVVRDLPFTVTNTGRGVGTLVPGAAVLVFEVERVHDGRSAVVSRGTVAVVLAAAAGGVSQVIVTPSNFAFSAPGGTLQLTGVVLPSSAPQGIHWASSNAAVATISSTGFVTAWAPGATLMTATSAADPSKLATALISVVTQPVFGNGVNVSPGSWNAVPGMRLLFAAQVVNGPPSIMFASSSPIVVAVNSNGLATAVSRGNANVTARSVADPSQSADAPVTVFDFNFRAPVSPTLVSTGAVSPPANPLSVNIQAQACQAMTVLTQPFPRIDFEALTGTTWTTIGSAAFPSFVVDNGIERCWVFATTWTPGSAFGNGQQLVRAAAYDAFGGRSTTASNPWITTTTP